MNIYSCMFEVAFCLFFSIWAMCGLTFFFTCKWTPKPPFEVLKIILYVLLCGPLTTLCVVIVSLLLTTKWCMKKAMSLLESNVSAKHVEMVRIHSSPPKT